MTGRWRLAALFAVQALALIYMIADRQWTLARGTPVLAAVGGEPFRFRRFDPVYVLLRRA